MSSFFTILKIVIYEQRFNLLAMVIACTTWLVAANFVVDNFGKRYLDMFAYIITGWYWLGRVVMPWIEDKLEKLFG